jgi:tRNA A37 threonylcarbamoyladenosine modification protein TsaB
MTLLVNPISIPVQIGCYEDGRRICTKEIEGRVSDVLLGAIEELRDKYEISRFIYVSGPGSYMAIKLTYITLKTIEAMTGIPFGACSAFALNGNRPVRAMGKLYFVKEKETIITQKFDEQVTQEFGLPDCLGTLALESENTPLYIIPAV